MDTRGLSVFWKSSGGCARAHPPGVAPEVLERCVIPSRALSSEKGVFRATAGHACSPRVFSFDHSLGQNVGTAPEPLRVTRD
jgi:hypothetical protein